MSLRAIDIHHHYVPQVLLDEVKRHGNSLDVVISQTSDGHTSLSFAGGEKYQIQPDLPEIDRRLSVMDEGKIAIAVLEAHTASLGYRLDGARGESWCRLYNEGLHELEEAPRPLCRACGGAAPRPAAGGIGFGPRDSGPEILGRIHWLECERPILQHQGLRSVLGKSSRA